MEALTRDSGCLKDLTWRTDLPVDAVPEATRRLERAGYVLRNRTPVLIVDGPDGHRIVIVPRTGRVQLRISYIVPKERRAEEAHALYARLRTLWSERETVFARD